jgi:large subunit ribosomal protein L3
MPLGLIGTKVGMTQVFDEQGAANPVTVLQLGPCPVLQVRTKDRDGYEAVQLGFKDKPRKNATRAERGHVSNSLESKRRKKRQGQDIPKKADVEPQRVIREFKLDGVHREPGSTSSMASNRGSGRPKRGKKLPGRYGNERVTIRNLKVVSVDTENNLLLVRGAVPGFNGAYLMVRPTNKK